MNGDRLYVFAMATIPGMSTRHWRRLTVAVAVGPAIKMVAAEVRCKISHDLLCSYLHTNLV